MGLSKNQVRVVEVKIMAVGNAKPLILSEDNTGARHTRRGARSQLFAWPFGIQLRKVPTVHEVLNLCAPSTLTASSVLPITAHHAQQKTCPLPLTALKHRHNV